MTQHSSISSRMSPVSSRRNHLHTNNWRLAGILLAALPATLATAEAADPKPGLTAEECRTLLSRSTSGSAAYMPGVSASGQPVAAADLPADPGVSADGDSPNGAFDEVEIKLLGGLVPIEGTGIAGELRPGTLTVNTRTGEVLLDGKPLDSTDSAGLASYCAALKKRDKR